MSRTRRHGRRVQGTAEIAESNRRPQTPRAGARRRREIRAAVHARSSGARGHPPSAHRPHSPPRVAAAKFARRFTHEAQALAALNHPHIVTIHDFGQAGGYYFLLMEFVDGVNLRQAMKAGRFTPEQALAIVPPGCEALANAHGTRTH